MQKKLNEDFIDDYCEKFVDKVCSGFFANGKETISGKEILAITPSKQVNLFVIKLLFRYWQEETKKLKSPFFNYNSAEVKQAIVQFMNVLSQHIEVEEAKFRVLLNHALKDTIYLMQAPDAYIEIDLENRGVDTITPKSIEGTIKYLKIHKQEITDFLNDMKGLTFDDVLDELPDEFDNFDSTEAVRHECTLLSKILQLDPETLLSDDPEIDHDFDDEFDNDSPLSLGEEDLMPIKIEEENEDNKLTEETIETTETEPEVTPEPPEIVSTEAEAEPEPVSEEEPPEPEPETIIIRSEPPAPAVPKEEVKPLASIPSEEEEEELPDTLNKRFEKQEETVADRLEKDRSSDLLESISVNNRYMFTKELFKGASADFEACIYRLDEMTSFDESVEFVVQNYAKENGWDMQSESVKEFLKAIFRRFR